MAILRPGPLVAAVSGKLGGVVFAQGSRGQTARTLQRSTDSRTEYQLAHRANVSYLRKLWVDLTPAKRAAYVALARNYQWPDALGQRRPPTPLTVFLWHQGLRLDAGLDPETADPWWPLSPQARNLNVGWGGAYELNVSWDAATAPAGSVAMVYATRTFRQTPPTTAPPLPLMRSVTLAGNNAALTGQLAERQGALESGEYVIVQIRLMYDNHLPGALSGWYAEARP